MIRLDLDDAPGDRRRVGMPHPEVFRVLRPGLLLLVDDGKVRLEVKRSDATSADVEVVAGESLSDHKGLAIPGVTIPVPALTPKDQIDAQFALRIGVDWLALSFVQHAADMASLRKIVGTRAAILAKIEKPAAVNELGAILDVSDGLMVARGDLGVELAPEEVPVVQKQIVRAARRRGVPVIIATQMLESMISNPAPTRAEASDVAGGVYEGADALMLSAESAAGAYPVAAVETMDRIATAVEGDPLYREFIESQRGKPERTTPDAIMAAVHEVTQTIDAKAIVCWTKSGITAMRAARERSVAPIIAPTPSLDTARRLCLVWGTHSVLTEDIRDFDDMVKRASEIARQEGFAQGGERIVITAGVPLGTTGATNMLRVAFVSDEH
jgi:pyruvate kinase